MRLFTHRMFSLHSKPHHSRSHSSSRSLNWFADVKPNTRRRWNPFGRQRRTSAKEDGEDNYIRDTDVAKEDPGHYQLTGLPRLNTVFTPQDFPDYLFVHYAAISPKPVLYIRALPSPTALVPPSDADARCQNVAHLHIPDDPHVSPHRPFALTRLASFTFNPTVGEYRAPYRARVMAMMSPPVCCARDALCEVARKRYEERSKCHAEGKGFELGDPKFYGLYVPPGCLGRELHIGCNPQGCGEGTPILLMEDPFEEFVGAQQYRSRVTSSV